MSKVELWSFSVQAQIELICLTMLFKAAKLWPILTNIGNNGDRDDSSNLLSVGVERERNQVFV